jgi:hypothetical protein
VLAVAVAWQGVWLFNRGVWQDAWQCGHGGVVFVVAVDPSDAQGSVWACIRLPVEVYVEAMCSSRGCVCCVSAIVCVWTQAPLLAFVL